MIKIEYNALTGITTEREMTAEEIAQMVAQDIEQGERTPTLEERVSAVEDVTEEMITILNDKGIAP